MAKTPGGKAVEQAYQPVGSGGSFKDRALNITKWVAIGAAASALVALVGILTGGAALPALSVILAAIGKAALAGAAEGLLYSLAYEVMSKKKADSLLAEAWQQQQKTMSQTQQSTKAVPRAEKAVLLSKTPLDNVKEHELR